MNFLIPNEEIMKARSLAPKTQKTVTLLSGGWDEAYAVASVVVDDLMPYAEVHEHAADVWRVLAGTGAFILGGELENPVSPKEGEWTGENIIGGERMAVSPGDVINIPKGIPHQIDAKGTRLELLIVKIRY